MHEKVTCMYQFWCNLDGLGFSVEIKFPRPQIPHTKFHYFQQQFESLAQWLTIPGTMDGGGGAFSIRSN